MSPAGAPRKVDPRVAKRRQEVTRAAGRRRLRILLVLGAVVGFVLVVVGVLLSPVLDVDRVEVRGADHTSLAAVVETTGLSEPGHPMIAVDRFALAERIERLPWVDSAVVTRRWPSTVRVAITERAALGVIGVPGGVAVVDREGRVLSIAPSPPPGTFAITVAPRDRIPAPGQRVPASVRGALRVLVAFSRDFAAKVEAVHRLPGRPVNYDIGVRGGVTIRLGEAEGGADKLAAAEAVLAAQQAPGTVIDVRVPRSPTVTRQ